MKPQTFWEPGCPAPPDNNSAVSSGLCVHWSFYICQESVEYKRSNCAVQNASDLLTVVLGDVAGVVVVVLLPVLDKPVLLSEYSLQSRD